MTLHLGRLGATEFPFFCRLRGGKKGDAQNEWPACETETGLGNGQAFVAIRGNAVQPAAAFCYGLPRVDGYGLRFWPTTRAEWRNFHITIKPANGIGLAVLYQQLLVEGEEPL